MSMNMLVTWHPLGSMFEDEISRLTAEFSPTHDVFFIKFTEIYGKTLLF